METKTAPHEVSMNEGIKKWTETLKYLEGLQAAPDKSAYEAAERAKGRELIYSYHDDAKLEAEIQRAKDNVAEMKKTVNQS